MIVRRPLRAPEEDGAVLAEPPLDQVGRLLAENRRLLRAGPAVLGRRLEELRGQAVRDALAAAREYFERAGDPHPPFRAESLLISGHQPELVHPGVWVKHFALNGLAAAHGVTPVNLIVDYDTPKATVLRLPVLPESAESAAHAAALPFDHWTGEAPYEEREIRDHTLFDTLADRAAPLWRNWGYRPLLLEFWNEVRREAGRTNLLGECLARARREIEFRWGCHNWEVPVSALCRTEAFAWFAGHILADLPRFHRTYNDCVHEYRRAYSIRSRSHPVPDLQREGDWLEAPFWAWRAEAARRDRLFCRVTPTGLELRAGAEHWPSLPSPPHPLTPSPPQALVSAWPALEAQGLKVRPRALTNTLFARLFLADLFIHGIGGGKYDELTDEIVRRFYGMEPPRFLVLSATLRLPLPTAPATPEKCRQLLRRQRSLRYNPQRHLPEQAAADPAVRQLLAEHEHWVQDQPPTRRGRRERFAALRALTERLHEFVQDEGNLVQQELQRCRQELEANTVLRRRDYAAVLFPEEMLRGLVIGFLHIG